MPTKHLQAVTTWDYNAMALLKALMRNPHGIERFNRDPIAAAAGVGFALDPAFSKRIQKLNIWSQLSQVPVEVDQEVADFFASTISDGRFVAEWLKDPKSVAKRLGIIVSPEALRRVDEIAATEGLAHIQASGEVMMLPIVVAVVIVIAFGPKECRVVQPNDLNRF